MSTASTQGKNQKDTVAGATQVTKFARQIIEQGPISTIKEIPKLPDHQKAAVDQSNEWLKNIWPLIIKTTADIIDYANTFQATYQELETLIPALEKGDQKAKQDFIAALNGALLPTLQQKQVTSKDIASKIYKFSSSFNELYHSFQTDFEKANKIMTQDKEELVHAQANAAKYHAEAQAYEYAAVGAGVALPYTAAATVFLSETGIGLIIGGILVLGELAAIVTLLTKYVEAIDNYNNAMQEVYRLNQQVAQLTAIEKQITGLQNSSQSVSNSASNVADGWTALSDDLSNTIQHLENIKPEDAAILIKINLNAANNEWGELLKQAEILQPSGGQLDSKSFKTSSDMIKAMKSQISGS